MVAGEKAQRVPTEDSASFDHGASIQLSGPLYSNQAPPGEKCNASAGAVDVNDGISIGGGFNGTVGPTNRIDVPNGKTIDYVRVQFDYNHTYMNPIGGINPLIPYVRVAYLGEDGFWRTTVDRCWIGNQTTEHPYSDQDQNPNSNPVTMRFEASSDDFSPNYIGFQSYPQYAPPYPPDDQNDPLMDVTVVYNDGSEEEIQYNFLDDEDRVTRGPTRLDSAPVHTEPIVINTSVDPANITLTYDSEASGQQTTTVSWFGVRNGSQIIPQWYQTEIQTTAPNSGNVTETALSFNESNMVYMVGWEKEDSFFSQWGGIEGTTRDNLPENVSINYENASSDTIEYTGSDELIPEGVAFPGAVACWNRGCTVTRNEPIVAVQAGGQLREMYVYKDVQIRNNNLADLLDSNTVSLTVSEYVRLFSRDYDVPGRLDEQQVQSQGRVEQAFSREEVSQVRAKTEALDRATLATDQRTQTFPRQAAILNTLGWQNMADDQFNGWGNNNERTLRCAENVASEADEFLSICNQIHNVAGSVRVYLNESKAVNVIRPSSTMSGFSSVGIQLSTNNRIRDETPGDGIRQRVDSASVTSELSSCLMINVDPDDVQGNISGDPCTSVQQNNVIKVLPTDRYSPRFSYDLSGISNSVLNNITFVSYIEGEYTQITQRWNDTRDEWVDIGQSTYDMSVADAAHVPDTRVYQQSTEARMAYIESEESPGNASAVEYFIDIDNSGVQGALWGGLSINGTNQILSQWDFMTWRDTKWDSIQVQSVQNTDSPEFPGAEDEINHRKIRTNNISGRCVGEFDYNNNRRLGIEAAANNTTVTLNFGVSVSGNLSANVTYREEINTSNGTQIVLRQSNIANGTYLQNQSQITLNGPNTTSLIEEIEFSWNTTPRVMPDTFVFENRTPPYDIDVDRLTIWNSAGGACAGGVARSQVQSTAVPSAATPMEIVAVPTESPNVVGEEAAYTTIEERNYVQNSTGEAKQYSSPFEGDPFPDNVRPGLDLNGSYNRTDSLVVHHSPEGIWESPDNPSEGNYGQPAVEVYDVNDITFNDLTVRGLPNVSVDVTSTDSTQTVRSVTITVKVLDNGSVRATVRRLEDYNPISYNRNSALRDGAIIYEGERYELNSSGSVVIDPGNESFGGELIYRPDEWYEIPASWNAYQGATTIDDVGNQANGPDFFYYIIRNLVGPVIVVGGFYWLFKRDYVLSRLGVSD
jgi:hypothetical protein